MFTQQLLVFIFIAISNGHDQSHQRSNGCGINNQPSPSNSTIEFSFPHNNINRIYLIHIPPTYNHNSSSGSPLIFGLHGTNSTAQSMSDQFHMNQHSDKHNYIAIYPQGSTMENMTSWNDLSCSGSNILTDATTCKPSVNPPINTNIPPECRMNDPFNCNWCNCLVDDIDFIDKLIDHITSQYCIDTTRIYSLGFSNGAMMTQRLGCTLNHRFAAIAPFHGQLSPAYNCVPDIDKDAFIPMSILNVWGWRDDTVPGESCLSVTGSYFAPVSSVMLKFGSYNGCNMSNGLQVIDTVSDGIEGWECIGFREGCINESEVISCGWNGTHEYSVMVNMTSGEIYNFGLEVAWNFFMRHTKEVSEEDDYNDTRWDTSTIIIAVSVGTVFVLAVIVWILCHVRGHKDAYDLLSEERNEQITGRYNGSQPLTSTKTKAKK